MKVILPFFATTFLAVPGLSGQADPAAKKPTPPAEEESAAAGAHRHFAGAFLAAADGSRYYINGLEDGNGRCLIYRIIPDVPNFRMYLGKVQTASRLSGEGVGGTKGTVVIEFHEEAIRVATSETPEGPVTRETLTRDEAIASPSAFWHAYLGKLSRKTAKPDS